MPACLDNAKSVSDGGYCSLIAFSVEFSHNSAIIRNIVFGEHREGVGNLMPLPLIHTDTVMNNPVDLVFFLDLKMLRIAAIVGVGTLLQSLCSVLSKASQVDGKYEYSTLISNTLTEVVKLLIAGLLFAFRTPRTQRNSELFTLCRSRRHLIYFALPGLLYLGVNYTFFVLYTVTTPSTAQILSNFKVITTAVLSEFIFGRLLSRPQWLALVLTFTGLTLSSWPLGDSDFGSNLATACIVALIFAAFSAAAGISCEAVFKSTNYSIHLKNSTLYVYGVLMSVATAAIKDPGVIINPFHGFNRYAVLLICTRAVAGLVISAIMKYGDTILKNFSSAASLCVTVFLANICFGDAIVPQELFAVLLIFLALMMYGLPEVKAGSITRGGGTVEPMWKKWIARQPEAPLPTFDDKEELDDESASV